MTKSWTVFEEQRFEAALDAVWMRRDLCDMEKQAHAGRLAGIARSGELHRDHPRNGFEASMGARDWMLDAGALVIRGRELTASQRDTDHDAPFRDVMGEGDDGVAVRIAAIDQVALREWWERFGRYTHPGTFGDSGCDRTYSVACALFRARAADCRDARIVAIARRVLAVWTDNARRRWTSGDCSHCGRVAPD